MLEYESEPLQLFLYAMRSDATKDRYKRRLGNFFEFLELDGTLAEQSKQFIINSKEKGNTWVTASVMRFLSFHKERVERGEIAEGTLRNYYKPIKLFLEMNDIELSWRKITRGLPRGRKHAADRAPTVEEIRKLIEYPDRRIKAIVFTMCSSGIRLGAWDYLKWSHIIPIKQDDKVIAAKIIVYAGDSEQYFSFITPEAYNELKKWMDFRAEAGEKITGESWLMRDLWNVEKFAKGLVTIPKQLKSLGLKRLMERALKAQGIRKNLPEGQKRHEFQADHGLRKFFKTHSEQSMKPINVETLMGHSTGISDSYYRPNENELLQDYLNAASELTIMSENHHKMQIQKQEQRISALESERAKVTHLEKGLNLFAKLMGEQKIKNDILHELEFPTHHHTEEQIKSLKEFALSPPVRENWNKFFEWSKNGPKVYKKTKNQDADKDGIGRES